MPNSVKYSTTTPLNSLRKGNVAIGVNDVDMGPTTSTGWYNGVTPSGNYPIIYKTTALGDPDAFAPQSDQELYNFVIMQGGNSSNTTSVGAALAWIATQSDLLAIENPFNNMVTDGLVLALDAGNISSYPTTGTTWYDLSGVGNNGTLTNGPTFNSNGWFDFDGVDDQVIPPNSSIPSTSTTNKVSICFWSYGKTENSANSIIEATDSNGSRTVNIHMPWSNNTIYWDSPNRITYQLSAGQSLGWNYWSFTKDTSTGVNSIYQNGNLLTTGTGASTNINPTTTVKIGSYTNNTTDWRGDLSTFQIYNKALTSSEIIQNYYGAPNIPSNVKMALNRSQNGVTITNSGWGFDLAQEYDNLQTFGYSNSNLNGDFDGLTAFTYCIWLHCYSHHTGYSTTPFSKYAGTTTAVIRLYNFGNYLGNGDQGKLRFYANAGGVWTSVSSGNTYLDVGETGFLCVQWDSVNGGDTWWNGEKIATGAGNRGTMATNTANFEIITSEYQGEQYTQVKEAYVYTEKLSNQQIEDLYNATRVKYNV